MLAPKRVKWRRPHKAAQRLNRGVSKGGNSVTQGDYGLQALEASFVTDRQIEAARIAMTRFIKRGGQVWIKIFPHKSITRKPAETRMGSGKGAPEYWVAVVKPGRVMFELAGVDEATAKEALRLASHKLPVKCKFVKREGLETVAPTAETGGETNEG
ncbi:MAG: 50S ribosomal protein L16 [Mycobacterium leprae]